MLPLETIFDYCSTYGMSLLYQCVMSVFHVARERKALPNCNVTPRYRCRLSFNLRNESFVPMRYVCSFFCPPNRLLANS